MLPLALATLSLFVLASTLAQTSQAGSELRLGFWNIRDLSTASRDDTEVKQIATVASKMDCLAIAEVNDTNILTRLDAALAGLGGKWQRVQTSKKVGNTSGSAEYYGFVYRSDKLAVRGKPHVLAEKMLTLPAGSEPHAFDREPFVCSFTTLDKRFDFTVIVVHITWGSGSMATTYRVAEVRALKDYFAQVQRSDTKDNDVILCGDFNENVNDPKTLAFVLTTPAMIDSTAPNVPTTLGTSNTYDHILFQTNYLAEYTGTHGVEKFDEYLFGTNVVAAKKACSDHRPVWITVRVPNADDD